MPARGKPSLMPNITACAPPNDTRRARLCALPSLQWTGHAGDLLHRLIGLLFCDRRVTQALYQYVQGGFDCVPLGFDDVFEQWLEHFSADATSSLFLYSALEPETVD